jgi:DNA-binding response OmpR family regulator
MRLLVIDDSQTIRKLVEISFRGSPFTLDFAGTGADGVARAAQGTPAVILLDYVLPDMKATDVCRRLSADERCADIPVLVMSAKTELSTEDLRSAGKVVGFLPKPFTGPEVVARVNAAVAERPRRWAFKEKEIAAKVLYQKLKRHLEALPELARERGDAPPAPYFARKLLTGDVVEALLEALAPLYQAPGPEASGPQRELERLRRPGAGEPEADPELVYERAAGFSAKLRLLSLGANEQRVLTVVDGRSSVDRIAERCGLPAREVGRILFRLGAIDLVCPRHTFRSSSVMTARLLSILDPDRNGVQHSLQALLRRRPEPIEVRDLSAEADPVAAIKRDRPCLVMLNPEGNELDVAQMARELRQSEALANTSLAAVLERRSAARIDQLAAAGFDAVWVKPLQFGQVAQLIASAFLTADLVQSPERKENHGNHPHH